MPLFDFFRKKKSVTEVTDFYQPLFLFLAASAFFLFFTEGFS